jgi:hypothetical protein
MLCRGSGDQSPYPVRDRQRLGGETIGQHAGERGVEIADCCVGQAGADAGFTGLETFSPTRGRRGLAGGGSVNGVRAFRR